MECCAAFRLCQAAGEYYGRGRVNTLVVVVVFDRRNGLILNAEASVITNLSKNFISELLVGYNLNDGLEPLVSNIEEYYFGSTKKALETALRMIFQRYQEYRAANPESKFYHA